MAIAAIDSIITDVMFVAERHRLSARHSYFGNVWGFIDGRESRHHRDQENETAENRDPRNRVRAWVNNLRHRLLLSTPHTTSKRRVLVAADALCASRRRLRAPLGKIILSGSARIARYSLRIPKLSIFR